jgi:hypothetical protein
MKMSRLILAALVVMTSLIVVLQPAYAKVNSREHHGVVCYVLIVTTNINTAPLLPGTGCYRLNALVTITAPSTLIGFNGAVLHFNHWTWSAQGNSTVAQIRITGDMAAKAVYT